MAYDGVTVRDNYQWAKVKLIDEEDPECYLLRASCLQIEGDPSQAFADLQAFIGILINSKVSPPPRG